MSSSTTSSLSGSNTTKRSRDRDLDESSDVWASARQSRSSLASVGELDIPDKLEPDSKTPFDFFGQRKQWALAIRENANAQATFSKYNPCISYCMLHDKFTGDEIPSDQRDESCYKCIKGRFRLIDADYNKIAFPCSKFDAQGREKDRSLFLKLHSQLKEAVVKATAVMGPRYTEDKVVQKLTYETQTAWHAYALQTYHVGELVRLKYPREKKLETEEEKKDQEYLLKYIQKAVVDSINFFGVNVFKVLCLSHNKITCGVPMSPIDKYDPNCGLCLLDLKPVRSLYVNLSGSSDSDKKYTLERVGDSAYFKLK